MKWLIPAILVGLLGLFFFTDSLKIESEQPIQYVGQVLSAEGQVMGLSSKDSSFLNVRAKDGLLSPHQIKTGIESSSTLEYGETFKLQPNTSVRLTKIKGEYHIHILKGRVERESISTNTKFFINGKKGDDLHLGVHTPQPMTAIKKTQQQSNQKPKSRHRKKLEETVKLHQRFLEKCFIKHYERSEGQTSQGIVTTRFIITKKGKLSQVEILESQYKDPEFHQCIQDVVSRIRIRNYNGKTTPVEFPFKFSLPL